jgi:hypothetical protein
MEIKGILEKIRQKEPKKEFIFALEIDHELVKSAIWGIVDNQVKVMAIGDTFPWEKEEELVQAVDMTFSSVVQKFSPQQELVEPNKVVLGLPMDWVEQDKIISEKSQLIRKFSKQLELHPIGFVLIGEAIIHYLKTNEGVPPTAIIVGLGAKRLTISLVKLGKIIGTQYVKRSGNLGPDLYEGLTRFTNQEVFPARILIYGKEGGKDKSEEARQELMNYSWPKEMVNFLHLPKIEILAVDFDIQAIALAGGKEISQGQARGFLAAKEEVVEEKEKEEKKVDEEVTEMGFIEGKDITDEPNLPEGQPEAISELPPQSPPQRPKIPKLNLVSWLALFKLPKLRIKFNFSSRSAVIGGILLIFLVILVGLAVAYWWYAPRAQVTLYVKTKALDESFSVRLDPSAQSIDKEKLILPVQKQEATADGGKTIATTGVKLVGESAKGTVAIYNRTNSEKTLNAGVEIIGPNGLKFSLDDKVMIASISAGSDYTEVPGKSSVNVTALKIGSEGNLAVATEFTVANFARSDFVAKNDSAFTGGSSREVQAVSKKDQDKLIDDLTNELKKKATEELKTKIDSQYKLVGESVAEKITEKIFSQDIGTETNEVSLKMKMKVSALSYSEDDLSKLIQNQIDQSVLQGFEYKSEESETSFVLKEMTKDGVAIFSVRYQVKLIPKLDLDMIRKNLSGKYLDLGRSYLETLPEVDSAEIKITPTLPIKIKTFPRIIKNIEIEVVVK